MKYIHTRYLFILILLTVFSFLDRITKSMALHYNTILSDTSRVLEFVFVCNKYSAFGIPIAPIFLYIVFFVSILFCIVGIRKNKKQLVPLFADTPFVLIIVGASSNLWDRFVQGCVIDFISVGWWPVFNLADMYIVCGVMWLVYIELKTEKVQKPN